MEEKKILEEINKIDNEKVEKISKTIENIKNKKSSFYFLIPETDNPSALIYELYFHATTVKNMGYGVTILVEEENYEVPSWIESELTDFKHIPISNPKLTVSPEDFMIIPEIFTNVMEQTKNLPCMRIGVLQSIDYKLNSLIPGTDWSTFGVRDVITTSKNLEDIVKSYYPNKYRIKTYDIGIPDYFKKSDKPQKPIISIVGRNPNEITKLIKLFFSKYPHYSWVSFDPMLTKGKPPQTMRRIDFAERLGENFAAVWIDRISAFGTFPLECMKTGTIPIALKPDIIPEYIIERDEEGNPISLKDNIGVWTDDFYNLPDLIANSIVKFLDDNIPEEIYESMDKVAEKYSQENSEKQLTKIYQDYLGGRLEFFETALNDLTNKESK